MLGINSLTKSNTITIDQVLAVNSFSTHNSIKLPLNLNDLN